MIKKKWKNIALVILGIISFNILWIMLFFGDLDVYFLNLLNHPKVPEEFADYMNITKKNPVRFGNHELQHLSDIAQFNYHIISKNNLVVATKNGTNNNYYKLDLNGNLVDTYNYIGRNEYDTEQIISENLVNIKKDYFRTWIVDGDTLKHPFIKQNEKLTWSHKQQLEFLQKIKQENKFYTMLSDGTYNKDNLSIKYLRGNVWYKMYVDNDFEKSEYTSFEEEKISVPDDDEMTGIIPVYFGKTELKKLTGGIGGGSIQTSEYYWKGHLYCKLWEGEDTLKFKTPILVKRDLLSGDKKTMLHNILASELISKTNFQNFNFSIFANGLDDLYVVKRIK